MPYALAFPANEVCSHKIVCPMGEYALSEYMPYMRVDCTLQIRIIIAHLSFDHEQLCVPVQVLTQPIKRPSGLTVTLQ